ncbi:MAG: hypothetical protein C0169_00050, partial [Thermodesulfobacterium geofontis]
REEFPEIYEKIIDKPELIKEISEAISSDKFSKNKKGLWEYKGEDKQSLKEIKLTEEQYRFFMRTSNIVMDAIKLEPFFVNRDLFKDLPDRVYNLVISQDWEELKNMIESGQITLERLINYINDKLNEDVIKRGLYDTSGFNLLSLIFKIIHDKEQEISEVPQYIMSVLEHNEVYKNIYKFPRKQFFFSLQWFKKKGITTPLDKTIEEINKLPAIIIKNDFIRDFILAFKEDKEVLSEIKRKLSKSFSLREDLYKFLKEITNDEELIKYLLDTSSEKLTT